MADGPAPWVWAAAAGAVLLLAALAWRWAHRRRTASRLAEALRAEDPVRRRAAVAVAAEQGLRQCGALLLGRTAVERDPAVVDALVGAVLRNAWEPADRPGILALRLWAHERRPGATPSGSAGAIPANDTAGTPTGPPAPAPALRVADLPLRRPGAARSAPGAAALFAPVAAPRRAPHVARHRAAAPTTAIRGLLR